MKVPYRPHAPRHAAEPGPDRLRPWLILVLVLVLLKIVYALSMLNSGALNTRLQNLFGADVAAKEEQREESSGEQGRAQTDNASSASQPQANERWSIELAAALKQRERDLTQRQDALRREEERLNDLKREIEAKIQTLAELEKKVSDLISAKKGIEEEKLMKLAKVFEETPPEQAGPLLSKLDVDIAAELLLKMTGRKAGKIWGYVDPVRAVAISKALARINPNIDMNKLSDNTSSER